MNFWVCACVCVKKLNIIIIIRNAALSDICVHIIIIISDRYVVPPRHHHEDDTTIISVSSSATVSWSFRDICLKCRKCRYYQKDLNKGESLAASTNSASEASDYSPSGSLTITFGGYIWRGCTHSLPPSLTFFINNDDVSHVKKILKCHKNSILSSNSMIIMMARRRDRRCYELNDVSNYMIWLIL